MNANANTRLAGRAWFRWMATRAGADGMVMIVNWR